MLHAIVLSLPLPAMINEMTDRALDIDECA